MNLHVAHWRRSAAQNGATLIPDIGAGGSTSIRTSAVSLHNRCVAAYLPQLAANAAAAMLATTSHNAESRATQPAQPCWSHWQPETGTTHPPATPTQADVALEAGAS